LLSGKVRAFLCAETSFSSVQGRTGPLTLSLLANIGSIAGCLATFVTWWIAYRSRRYYLLVGRVPDHIERLRRSTSQLAVSNNKPTRDRSEILHALKQVREATESIRQNVSWTRRGDFGDLVNRIRRIENSSTFDPNTVDEVWAEGEALAERAEALVQDRKFTRGS
jgi:hypothetical protein